MTFAAVVLSARGASAGPEEVPGLIQLLITGSVGEQNHAIQRLQFLGPDVAGPPLRRLLMSEDPKELIAATDALGVVRYPPATPLLERLVLIADDWEVRRNAVRALGTIHAQHARKLISRTLRTDKQPRVRKACVQALAQIGGANRAVAEAAVKDDDLEVRMEALDVLAKARDRSVASVLWPLLKDSSELVRYATARSLAWQNDLHARWVLTKAIATCDPEQMNRAVTALTDVPYSWAADLLAKVLGVADTRVGCAAAAALVRRKDDRGKAYLIKLAASGGPDAERAESWLDTFGITPGKP